MDIKTINEIFRRFSENNIEPQIELKYTNPYTLLVAIVLSAQSTDKGVNKATPALFEVVDTPGKMLELGLENLKSYIKTIGLYNTKAKNIIALSKMLIDEFDGEVPCDFIKLQKLPGVGRKTANVFLNSLFKHPTIGVDTHVLRVSNRIGLCNTKTPLHTEIALQKIIPNKWLPYVSHWLVLHGRYVCIARKPKCNNCIINDLCNYAHKTFS